MVRRRLDGTKTGLKTFSFRGRSEAETCNVSLVQINQAHLVRDREETSLFRDLNVLIYRGILEEALKFVKTIIILFTKDGTRSISVILQEVLEKHDFHESETKVKMTFSEAGYVLGGPISLMKDYKNNGSS